MLPLRARETRVHLFNEYFGVYAQRLETCRVARVKSSHFPCLSDNIHFLRVPHGCVCAEPLQWLSNNKI